MPDAATVTPQEVWSARLLRLMNEQDGKETPPDIVELAEMDPHAVGRHLQSVSASARQEQSPHDEAEGQPSDVEIQPVGLLLEAGSDAVDGGHEPGRFVGATSTPELEHSSDAESDSGSFLVLVTNTNELDKSVGGARRKVRKKSNPLRSGKVIDYKDTATLRKFISERGKIRARRVKGLSVQDQRKVALAIKNARQRGDLPTLPVDALEGALKPKAPTAAKKGRRP